MTPPHSTLNVFTDGSCLGNPGPGGWGVLIKQGVKETELSGSEAMTTNNRMELLAVIRALQHISPQAAQTIALYTDSQYVKKGMTEWLAGWKRKGWKTAAGKPVKNQDLWQLLSDAAAQHTLSWHWVEGHSGHAENERADTLARNAASQVRGE